MHATAVAVDGRAVLIRGASGCGKSALGLRLMALGAVLVADDRVILTATDHGVQLSCPDVLLGMIEARGVGLLNADVTGGPVALALVIDMDQVETDRLPRQRSVTLLGHDFPLLHRVDAAHFGDAIWQYLRAGRRA
jgi:HPr kinase/phosphorylase